MVDALILVMGLAGAIVIGFAVCFLAVEILLWYSLQDRVLRIVLFGVLPVRRIDLQEVKDVKVIRFRDWSPFGVTAHYLWAERWGGCLLFVRGVAITLLSGKTILIAPRHRDEIVETIQSQMRRVSSDPTTRASDSAFLLR